LIQVSTCSILWCDAIVRSTRVSNRYWRHNRWCAVNENR